MRAMTASDLSRWLLIVLCGKIYATAFTAAEEIPLMHLETIAHVCSAFPARRALLGVTTFVWGGGASIAVTE